MAGRNHHYIPQALQRGFAASITSKGASQVWVFRKGRAAFLSNTKNVFVSKDFYGEPERPEVDLALTAEETWLATFLSRSRDCSAVVEIGRSEEAAALAYQLCVRIRWIRQFGERAASIAVEHVADRIGTPEGQAQLMIEQCQTNPTFLSDELEKHLIARLQRSLTPREKTEVATLAASLIGNPSVLAGLLSGTTPPPLPDLAAIIPKAVAGGHQRGLEKVVGNDGNAFRDYMRNLLWRVLPTDIPLVLGDSGPIFFNAARGFIGPVGAGESEERYGLVLPIGKQSLLVGLSESGRKIPMIEQVNAMSAGWSSEAFIASSRDEYNDELHTSMGCLMERFFDVESRELFGR